MSGTLFFHSKVQLPTITEDQKVYTIMQYGVTLITTATQALVSQCCLLRWIIIVGKKS